MLCDDPDCMCVLWLYKLFIWLKFLKYYSDAFVTHHIQNDGKRERESRSSFAIYQLFTIEGLHSPSTCFTIDGPHPPSMFFTTDALILWFIAKFNFHLHINEIDLFFTLIWVLDSIVVEIRFRLKCFCSVLALHFTLFMLQWYIDIVDHMFVKMIDLVDFVFLIYWYIDIDYLNCTERVRANIYCFVSLVKVSFQALLW